MKKLLILTTISLVLLSANLLGACSADDPIRIHIRANSNDTACQSIKLVVKDYVTTYLTSALDGVATRDDALTVLENSTSDVTTLCNYVLASCAVSYTASVRVCNEYFPLRSYNGEVYESGYYDAFIVELGTGEGDNWWCVAYPPLCFYGSSDVQYTSLIAELLGW